MEAIFMFEHLSDRLSATFKRLKGHGKLNERNINDTLREVRLALFEADVHYKVVNDFIEQVFERAVGKEVMMSLTPAQQVIKIVDEELTTLMGGQAQSLSLKGTIPLIYMIVGLQGSGKTTTSAKLALELRKHKRHPYLVSVDVRRPAAIEQLKRLGAQIQIPVHDNSPGSSSIDICMQAFSNVSKVSADIIILDTAGRLHVDKLLMTELEIIKNRLNPQEVLLVADAMTGQDAVNVAKIFHDRLKLSGVILTKIEGDARGGAALSIKAITKVPIKFLGVGEKLDALKYFYPERMAKSILGMGDILSLVEKAQRVYKQDETKSIVKKIAQNKFTLEDYRNQLIQLKKIGSLESIIEMLPRTSKIKQYKNFKSEKDKLKRFEAIINSMTSAERVNSKIINASRRKRIATGSGTSVTYVNQLLKNFFEIRKVMKNITRVGNNKKQLAKFFTFR